MKKLLFSVSIIVLLGSCGDGNKKQPGDGDLVIEPKTDNTSVDKELETVLEDKNAELNIDQPSAEKAGNSMDAPSKEVDPSNKEKQSINHGNPDQSKIDSIKAAKQKGKK